MAGTSENAEAQREALLVETRRRSGCINRYVDMIPARFYLSSEALAAHKPRSSLDPAQYKRTSDLLVEVLNAQADAASAGSSSQAKKNQKKKKNGAQARPSLEEGPTSRGDLRKLLEQRIAELTEERRKKQSVADSERNANAKTAAKPAAKPAASDKRPIEEATASAAPAKKQRIEAAASPRLGAAVKEDDVEAGRLSFTPRLGELPYEAGINRKGSKVRMLRSNLRKEESKIRKLESVEDKDERAALSGKFALDKALRRARGEKVHDDVGRLRKTQKQLETSKAKQKEKWTERVTHNDTVARDGQERRKNNIKARREKKQGKGGKGRAGFEGKKQGFLNSQE